MFEKKKRKGSNLKGKKNQAKKNYNFLPKKLNLSFAKHHVKKPNI